MDKIDKDILFENCEGCIWAKDFYDHKIPMDFTYLIQDLNNDCRNDIVLETRNSQNERVLNFLLIVNNKLYIKN